MLESGGEKTQPVSQKQRKNACMTVLLLTIVIAVGGCVGEMGFDGIIGSGHMINNAYAEESVLLVTNETAKFTASDAAARDHFGHSVSVYNTTAVIGAHGDDDNGPISGSAYVFEYSSGTWTQKAKLVADDGAAYDYFGRSVSVYNNTAVIGADGDDDNGSYFSSAYVFEYSSGTWTQKAKLVADDAAAYDYFGRSVSVYNNTAVIGAYADDDNGPTSGSAYVFEYSSGTWTQKAKLVADDAAARDHFGRSVSVYNNTAVIGADGDDDNGPTSGSAYVFEYSSGTWTQKAKLVADDAAARDHFGRSVSVYGNTAVIGAYADDDNGSYSGSAYVFEYSSGTWTQKAKLVADDGAAYDRFGRSVSVYGNTAVIGAYYDDDNGSYSGSAYVFEYSSGTWTQKAKLVADDAAARDHFGRSVSVYNNTAVIGADGDDDNGSYSGSAYVFTISANQAPTAHAGDDQTVDEGTDVTLEGSVTDPDTDDTITYAWSQTQGPTVTLSSSTSGSSGSSSSDSSSGIGTSGGGGGSGSSSGIGTSGGGGGGGGGSSTWVDNVYLKSVSWDCNAGTIKIIAGPDSDYISVAVHTTQLGIHQASIAGDDIPGYRAFVSPMHKTEDYINIKAVALSGRNLVTISESINVDACVGERTYHAPDDSTTTTIKQPVPKQEDDKDRLADFVDPKKNPQYYIDRYNNEIEYREWFDENYPGITIYDAVGLPVPDPTLEPAVEQEPAMKQEPEPICDPRAELVDGFCIPVTPRPEENGGGCLIATAAYGTELAPQVQLLREIRDNMVLQTQSGSAFMDSFNSFYYSFSPSIADLERQNPVFREAVKMAVTPLISSLAILDYVDIDSESEMLGYGIGIVAMNIAMYVALPVSALYYVRRLVA